ncbi:hypothetical protein MJA45_06690 [Paenibacillus aurantius]|uniref:Sporulation protein n=1 Tax=Paenibacillus aurantius TaxID=2918900 RepID=A0AA96LEQ3_9BACL|nr:hypothetical protein [Paenibacillus aurantius]WNQ12714.1 hypothetical protein MJA45_06690 [Paenibacillus aurantius]
MRLAAVFTIFLLLLMNGAWTSPASAIPAAETPRAVQAAPVVPPPLVNEPAEDDGLQPQAYRSGRGSYRSPAGGYRGGNRAVTPGAGVTRPGAGQPGTRTPAAPGRTGFGSFFGGLAAGTFLGSLLNPFGFGGYGGYGGGVSLIGIILWAAVLFFLFRLIRRVLGRR